MKIALINEKHKFCLLKHFSNSLFFVYLCFFNNTFLLPPAVQNNSNNSPLGSNSNPLPKNLAKKKLQHRLKGTKIKRKTRLIINSVSTLANILFNKETKFPLFILTKKKIHFGHKSYLKSRLK